MLSHDYIGIAKKAFKREGIKYLVTNGSKFAVSTVTDNILNCYYKKFYSENTFEFQGKKYHYYINSRGKTWKTERAVEIPIIWEFVNEYKNNKKRILEIGNVLSYRFETSHDILDKYEKVPGVINEDVASFVPDGHYDLIVSISTMEHVGWDESPQDPPKITRGIQNLNRMLSPTGKMIITLPLGQNSYLDGLLMENKVIFDKQYFLLKSAKLNWTQVNWENIMNFNYDKKIPAANCILIGINQKKEPR